MPGDPEHTTPGSSPRGRPPPPPTNPEYPALTSGLTLPEMIEATTLSKPGSKSLPASRAQSPVKSAIKGTKGKDPAELSARFLNLGSHPVTVPTAPELLPSPDRYEDEKQLGADPVEDKPEDFYRAKEPPGPAILDASDSEADDNLAHINVGDRSATRAALLQAREANLKLQALTDKIAALEAASVTPQPSKPACPPYVTPYLRGPHGGLPPASPAALFSTPAPPALPSNPSGSGSKDMKMEPIAKWDGKPKTMRAFLVDCSNHFEFQPERYNTDKRKVIAVCQACVGGIAEAWAVTIMEGDRPDLMTDHSAFIRELRASFGDPNLREQYVHDLTHLKQTTSVTEYAAKFEALIYQVGYRDGWADRFYSGLKPEVKQLFVSWHGDRSDYLEVKKAAINFDTRMQALKQEDRRANSNWKPGVGSKTPAGVSSSSTTTTMTTSTSPSSATSRASSQGPRGKLSDAERAKRFAEGLCLYCGDKTHQKINCPRLAAANNRKQAMLAATMLSGINESETAEASDPKVRLDLYKACILLNQYLNRDSLTLCASVLNPREGHLVIDGRVNGKKVKIMVDSGAQANFVCTKFMQDHLRDTATPFGKAIVDVQGGLLVARSETLQSEVQLEIEGFQPTKMSIIGIPNMIYDAVLGMPWLRSINPLIDWANLVVTPQQPLSPKMLLNPKLADLLDLQTVDLAELDRENITERDEKLEDRDEYIRRYFEGKIQLATTGVASLDTKTAKLPPAYAAYADVFDPEGSKHLPEYQDSIEHAIETVEGAKLPYRRCYKYSERELKFMKQWLDEMLATGKIRPSKSPCASPVLMAEKPHSDELRPCVDYRQLNSITVKNRHPIPLFDTMLKYIRGAKKYVKLDVQAAFNCLRIKPGQEYLTAFITPFGLFETLVMPFGLCNAPASWQAYIEKILGPLLNTDCVAFLDDILIYGDTDEEVRERAFKVLDRLREEGLYCKLSKCRFEVDEVDFLGYIVGHGHLRMDPDRVRAILEWPPPKRLRDVQVFLGFCNFYRRYILGYSHVANGLTDLLRKGVAFNFGPAAKESFEYLKTAFAKEPILREFDPSLPSTLETDASCVAVSGILSQRDPNSGELHPVAYYSKKLTPAELNYTTQEQELLAIVRCMEHWRHYLEGASHTITVLTDSNNLRTFNTTAELNRRQVRWLEDLSKFDFTIQHRPGKTNPADGLSRRPDYKVTEEDHQPRKDYLTFAATTVPAALHDDLIQALATDPLAQDMTTLTQEDTDWKWDQQVLWYEDKIYIPETLRPRILKERHDAPLAGHHGQKKTEELVSRDYFWPNMRKTVRDYVRGCQTDQRTKADHHRPYGLMGDHTIPEDEASRIHMDWITDLPLSKKGKNDAILAIQSALTKRLRLVPCRLKGRGRGKNLDAPGTAALLEQHWFKDFGLPKCIISDRDLRVINRFFKALCTRLGITHAPTSRYHPAGNGQIERTNSPVEAYLRAYVNANQDDWEDWLWTAEFAYNNTLHSATGMTPFYASDGRHRNIDVAPEAPGAVLDQAAATAHADRIAEITATLVEQHIHARDLMRKYYDERHLDVEFQEGDLVMLRHTNIDTTRPCKKLDYKKSGPYVIQRKFGPTAYELNLPQDMEIERTFHVNEFEKWNPTVPGQDSPEGHPVVVEGQAEWEVRAVIDSEEHPEHGFRYLVRWEGNYPDSWEPPHNLRGSAEHLDAFHRVRPDKPRPHAITLSLNPPETAREPDPGPATDTDPPDTEDSDSGDDSEPEYTPANPRPATGSTTGRRPQTRALTNTGQGPVRAAATLVPTTMKTGLLTVPTHIPHIANTLIL